MADLGYRADPQKVTRAKYVAGSDQDRAGKARLQISMDMSIPTVADMLGENLYWTPQEWRLGCKVCHPAHTIAFEYALGVSNFWEDHNVKMFLERHKDCEPYNPQA